MEEPVSRLVFLDTETTGLAHAEGDRIIEVAAVACVLRTFVPEPEGVFHEMVDPERDVPDEATAIHGMTRKDLQDKPKFAQIAQRLADFVRDAEIVIHNADFDCGFLNAEFERIGMPPIEEAAERITDSLQLARRMFPKAKNDLDSLCLRCGIDVRTRRPRHSALIDAQLLGEAYLHMTSGQCSLELDQLDAGEMQMEDAGQAVRIHALNLDPAAAERHRSYLEDMKRRSGVEPLLWETSD